MNHCSRSCGLAQWSGEAVHPRALLAVLVGEAVELRAGARVCGHDTRLADTLVRLNGADRRGCVDKRDRYCR